jgi:hypothetical protein
MSPDGTLPDWAERVIQAYGPHPACGEGVPNPYAAARYARIVERFRARWAVDLVPDVWSLFDGRQEQAAHLLGMMLDMARWGTVDELKAVRSGLDELLELEDSVRDLAETISRKLRRRSDVMHDCHLEGGLSDKAVAAVEVGVAAVLGESWREPCLIGAADYFGTGRSRKSQRDAVHYLLGQLDLFGSVLSPVKLTDRARATIYNVINDTAEYSPEAMKKARADRRAR